MSETLQNPSNKEVISKPDPLKKLYNYSFDEKRKWYKGSFEEFKSDYSSKENQLKLYDFLKNKKLLLMKILLQ